MRFILQHANVRSTEELDRWVEAGLQALRPILRIEEARVRVEYDDQSSPPYRASAHLVIPGPDLRVEAVDHTPRTVLHKILAHLKAKAVERAARRVRRHAQPHQRASARRLSLAHH